MAILPASKGSQRRPSLRGNIVQDTTRGVERTRIWPEPKGSRQTRAQLEQQEWFRQANWAFKLQAPQIQATMTAATKGTSLYPRDIFSIMASGGMFALVTPTRKVAYPMAAILAVSESLDALSQQEGFILVRGKERWEGKPYTASHAPWWWAPPPIDGWTMLSGAPWDLSISGSEITGVGVTGGAPVTGQRTALAMRAIPFKAQPWKMTFHHVSFIDTIDSSGVGLYLRDSVTGRLMSLSQRGNLQFSLDTWPSLTAAGTRLASASYAGNSESRHYQVEYDGTLLIWRISPDGTTWGEIYQAPANAYLTGLASHLCMGFTYNRTTGHRNVMNVDRWVFEQ